MQITESIGKFFTKRALEFEYYQVQNQISLLHHEIDKLSIELGNLVKRKCEVEIELNRDFAE